MKRAAVYLAVAATLFFVGYVAALFGTGPAVAAATLAFIVGAWFAPVGGS